MIYFKAHNHLLSIISATSLPWKEDSPFWRVKIVEKYEMKKFEVTAKKNLIT
jgi:hypothetical protein